MPDLIAQGPLADDRWRRAWPDERESSITVGRVESDWNVPWDSMISRRHVRLRSAGDQRLKVVCSDRARNPVFHRGARVTEFTLVSGDHFVIGNTTFTLAVRPGLATGDRQDVTEHAFDIQTLRKRRFTDAAGRIDVLSRLPDLIDGSGSDEELLVRVTSVLMSATPTASVIAIVKLTSGGEAANDRGVQLLHYDHRVAGRDGPLVSARLVARADELGETVLHLWSGHRDGSTMFTASEEVDWAFCVPLRSEACPGWALYLGGQLAARDGDDLNQSVRAAPENLRDDVKFAELVATMIAGLRQSRRLQRRQAALGPFFAPVVLEALSAREDDSALDPREETMSVMFCDLRGFSRTSREHGDRLMELLSRVSEALGLMTRRILETDGVIGDFHGDAAMGFWGWPLQQEDIAQRAALAAAAIRRDYRTQAAGGFTCGIGIATGDAVAGRIGTTDQVKVTAFGPVVNLASRLEGLTKAFAAEIIIDAETAGRIAADQPSLTEGGRFRTRRLARTRPAGWDEAIDVFQLITPPVDDEPTLTDDELAAHEDGLAAMIAGDWQRAYERFYALPAWDRPKDHLLSILLRHNRQAPENWDGVIG